MTDTSLMQPAQPAQAAQAARADARRAARGRDLLWLAIACLVLTVAGPWLFDTYLLNVLIKALFFAVAAVTVDILWGYTGYLTFGQSAFFGVGAYAAGLAFTHYGFSPGIALLAALVAVAAAMLLALLTGWLSFYRGASPFFATVISLVLPIVLTQVALSGGTYTGSSSGLTGYDTFDLSLQAWYVIAAGGLSIVALLAWVAVRSDGGRILAALRDNEGRCSYLGLNTAHWRIALLVVCGAVASLAGFGYGAFSGVVAPELTGFVFGTELIIWVALGGRGTVWGPVLGAVLINVAGSYLSGNMPFLYQLVLGVTFILVILLLPRGLLPLLLAPWRRRRPAPAPELVARPAAAAPGQGAGQDALALAGVAKRFGSLKVLEGIDLRARGGELLGLIGPNGAGKTTLMRCIADGAERSDGTVELCGQAIKREGPEHCVRHGLGRKFQNANIFDTLTVAESLRLATTLRERPSWRRRSARLALPGYALDVLRMTGLDQQLDRVARDLSHGQQQALELAMVLALEPRVVLLDEPTAGLSKDERVRIGQVLSALAHTHGLCCLLVEHDLDFVAEVATRIIVLHQGRIVMDGSFREVTESELVRTIYAGSAPAGQGAPADNPGENARGNPPGPQPAPPQGAPA
ncbi:MAG: ABC transporter permease subunit [Achromobacter sp.]|uniref:branched-chain amino acid ABC transporter ATP-binding protein/permease n=1 Tax=Achromobacter sp. TaxID=134375 RepID=UPI003D036387